MLRCSKSLYLLNKTSSTLFAILIIFTASCTQKSAKIDQNLKHLFIKVDSLNINNKPDSAAKLIKHIRASITTANPLICDYYCYVLRSHADNAALMNLYADSALAFFTTDARKNDYPDEYFKALLAKGDACLKLKKYITALNYYYKGKRILSAGSCDDGYLSSKMGVIYFNQKNYAQAAKYWFESYKKLEICGQKDIPARLFFTKQGGLNNAGFSYEKAGMLDSALKCYAQDLILINKAEKEKLVDNSNIMSARAVVYDNLGGINLKRGNLKVAEEYLKKCIAVPNDVDGAHIPPLLKLAALYMQSGQMDKALSCLQQSRRLLNKFYRGNPELDINWNKLYSEYLFSKKQPDQALIYQTNYLRLRDSSEKASTELYRLDVGRELNTQQQQYELTDLEQKNKIKVTYIAGICIIALLSIVIIVLISRSLKKTQKNHHDATVHNHQLQDTLGELELVNKNHIRIMRVMAHDLRNPLSGMTGLAGLLLEEEEFPEESKHMLRLIETTGAHSMEMINELLKSGLADENEQILKQKLDIQALLYDSVELLQFKAKEKEQQLIFKSDDQPIMAYVNHEKIWRVFNNVIVNAIKFSYRSSQIKVSIWKDQGDVLVSVADSGIGIPDQDKNSVFEMFTPAKKAGTNGEQPFGLGLSISKKIIEKHNGKIWFESTAGVGTTFYIRLPGTV